MSTAKVFDVCVVGAGLWGSAAAKYCSQRDNIKVCLVGPSEPTTIQERNGRSVFGAHYDEGRIFLVLSSVSDEWGKLAERSINRYKDIEEKTGTSISKEVGCAFVISKDSEVCRSVLQNADRNGVSVEVLSPEETMQTMKFLSLRRVFSDESRRVVTVLESTKAGYINPRSLLLAQQTLARRQGCVIVDDIVDRVTPSRADESYLELTTEGGKTIRAQKVLLCTGASTAFKNLLPPGVRLDTSVDRELAVMLELGETDRKRLRGMPCFIVKEDRDLGQNCYILPPIKYPDGKCYFKIGHYRIGQTEITSPEELKAWYCGNGNTETSERLQAIIRNMFPDLKPLSTHSHTCVSYNTPTGMLYCDMVTPRLGVLVGGNGKGALSSDEIGRMGAHMILRGDWDYDIPREVFRIKLKSGF